MQNYATWLEQATKQLVAADLAYANPQLEASLLFEFVTDCNRATQLAFGERLLTSNQLQQLQALLARRLQGEPIAYILQKQPFWSLDLAVSPATLIPRADTEIVVEVSLAIINQYQLLEHERLRILDLGCGTGAISLAIASELQAYKSKLDIIGVDKIPQAIQLAKQNGLTNQLKWVNFFVSDWFNQIENQQKFAIIVSNPPYIDKDDLNLIQGDVRFEPDSALIAANNGIADLQYIIEQSPKYLTPAGWLVLEHGYQQAEQVQAIFAQNNWHKIKTYPDYAGLSRVTCACYYG